VTDVRVTAPAAGVGDALAGLDRLRLAGVSKRFGAVAALTNVSLDVRAGEVHALVGENGAGKSTLMAIAGGSLVSDTGSVFVDGREIEGGSVEASREAGLAIAYQHPALMPDLTIAENMSLAQGAAGRPSWGDAEAWAAQALAVWCADRDIDPSLLVRDVPSDVRFMVETSRAVAQQPKVLLLDEPTEHLGARDVEILFSEVRRLAASGTAIVYISHRLQEVRQIADRISVLRDGELQAHGLPAAGVSGDELIRLIVGRPLEVAFPPKATHLDPASVALEVRGLTAGLVHDLDVTVGAGEIVGLAGIDGNGQKDVLRALAGLVRNPGKVVVGGRAVRRAGTAAAADAGFAYIPADRHTEGMFPALSVRENIAVGVLPALATGGVVHPERESRMARASVAALGIKTPSVETPVGVLSGGNQQKAVLARALERHPRVILADEPTQGVDVGARLEIYTIIRSATEAGAAALVVSSDGAELAGLCDRVIVLSRGTVVAELSGDEVTEAKIVEAAVSSSVLREPHSAQQPHSPWRRFLRGDLAPAAVVLLLAVLLGAFTATRSDAYLTGANFNGILTLFAGLAFAALAQQVVMISGGFDLSIGPLMGLLLVVASEVMPDGAGTGTIIGGLALLLVVACVVGVINWAPTALLDIPPFLTTLVTFTALQGVALLIQPELGPAINLGLLDGIVYAVGWFPVAAGVAIILAIALDLALRRTTWGISLRATGSRPDAALATGVRLSVVRLSAHLVAAVLTFLAGLLLISQVGAGDATAGTQYTLISVTAVVIGGASVFGGRGAFVGALAGAFLIQQLNTATSFLRLDVTWQQYLLGGLTLASAALYSKARSRA
jgi:ribose transport system ATP-binding protein